jgi:hypothetical protein
MQGARSARHHTSPPSISCSGGPSVTAVHRAQAHRSAHFLRSLPSVVALSVGSCVHNCAGRTGPRFLRRPPSIGCSAGDQCFEAAHPGAQTRLRVAARRLSVAPVSAEPCTERTCTRPGCAYFPHVRLSVAQTVVVDCLSLAPRRARRPVA